MASPKNTELLRRTLIETSSAYIRFQPKEEGWECVVEDSSGKVESFVDKNIETCAEQANKLILESRVETPGKKKAFSFKR